MLRERLSAYVMIVRVDSDYPVKSSLSNHTAPISRDKIALFAES
jgi:hypothetical protein